jgi:hypothetical protein
MLAASASWRPGYLTADLLREQIAGARAMTTAELGQTYQLASERPAAEIVTQLAGETRAALARAARRPSPA